MRTDGERKNSFLEPRVCIRSFCQRVYERREREGERTMERERESGSNEPDHEPVMTPHQHSCRFCESSLGRKLGKRMKMETFYPKNDGEREKVN